MRLTTDAGKAGRDCVAEVRPIKRAPRETHVVVVSDFWVELHIASEPPNLSFPTSMRHEATTTLAGTITSTALDGGSLTIATPTPFVRAYNTETFPHAGVGVATGANGGKVTVTALSSTTVRVDLDSNGDGTAEATVIKPWSTFE